MGNNKKKRASRIEKATAKKEKKLAQRIKKDIGKIGEVYLLNNIIFKSRYIESKKISFVSKI